MGRGYLIPLRYIRFPAHLAKRGKPPLDTPEEALAGNTGKKHTGGHFMTQDFEDKYAGDERPDPKPKSDRDRRKRQVQFKVRLSEAESARMEKIRECSALSAAAIVRRWINDQPLPNRSTDRLVGELRRQGGLLKHCAYGAGNRGAIGKTDMEQMVQYAAELARIARLIEEGATNDNQENTEE